MANQAELDLHRASVEALIKLDSSDPRRQAIEKMAQLNNINAAGLQDVQVRPVQVAPKESAPVEVRRFSDEAREALTKEGYAIYALSGQSIRSLRESGRKLWSTWHRDSQYEAFETKGSMVSEVAVKPDALFLPESNNETLKKQEDLIAKFSTDLGKKVKGVEAIMGEAPDYVGVAFAHLDATGDRLFGEKYDHNYARTKTPTVDSNVARVGDFNAVIGLSVNRWLRDHGDSSVFASPLVVPKS